MAINFKKIKFFVEGDADKVFIRDILKMGYEGIFNENQLNELIIKCDGYDGVAGKRSFFFEVKAGYKRENGKNIILFDADKTGRAENHGFEAKCKYLEGTKKELEIDFEYFLFPDHENDGTLETLLESCIQKEHKGILQCWNGYEDCINSISGKNYTIPANKSKIYAYLECLHGETNSEKNKIKDRNRDFTNINIWSFDFEKNPMLVRLKKFMDAALADFNI